MLWPDMWWKSQVCWRPLKRIEIYQFRDWLARQKICKETAEKWKGQTRSRVLIGLTGTKRGEDVNGLG